MGLAPTALFLHIGIIPRYYEQVGLTQEYLQFYHHVCLTHYERAVFALVARRLCRCCIFLHSLRSFHTQQTALSPPQLFDLSA
jgi:hypothetical protein